MIKNNQLIQHINSIDENIDNSSEIIIEIVIKLALLGNNFRLYNLH